MNTNSTYYMVITNLYEKGISCTEQDFSNSMDGFDEAEVELEIEFDKSLAYYKRNKKYIGDVLRVELWLMDDEDETNCKVIKQLTHKFTKDDFVK